MKVGLIGLGRLGKLIASKLGQDVDLVTYDINPETANNTAFHLGTLKQVCQAPIVILAVPISTIDLVTKQIAPLLNPNTLVIDTCSVKEYPVAKMQENLPSHISILGTHPMFGPDSAAKTFFGSKIVLCPVRVEKKLIEEIRAYLETHGLKVIVTTPEKHDKEISSSLILTHFIGRALIEFGAKELEIDTKGYRRLMKILETVENDSLQLFNDMNFYNPYANQARSELLESFASIDKGLGHDHCFSGN